MPPAPVPSSPKLDGLGLDGGFEDLLASMASLGSDSLSLPGYDAPTSAAGYVRVVLTGGIEEGWDFETAWSAAINRLQPGVDIQPGTEMVLQESRAQLEADRGLWRAAYEGRPPTPRERAESIAAGWTPVCVERMNGARRH